MSHATNPTRPGVSGSVPGMHHEFRRRGRMLGLGYEVGIRMTDLSEEIEPSQAAPQRPRAGRDWAESTEAQALEGICLWESERRK